MAWWHVALWVASLVISYALRPKPEEPTPARLQDLDVPTAEAGREIPVLFGTRDIGNANVVWYGHLRVHPYRKKGGKK